MSLFIFARFHAKGGCEQSLYDALHEVATPTRGDAGCRFMHVFRSQQDSALFFVHSEWDTPDALQAHVAMPHTQNFFAAVAELTDHPLDVSSTDKIF